MIPAIVAAAGGLLLVVALNVWAAIDYWTSPACRAARSRIVSCGSESLAESSNASK